MNSQTRTLFNVFPKSGTHMLLLHRPDLSDNDHVSMFKGGVFQEPDWYIAQIDKRYPRNFTGHIPYSPDVEAAVRKWDYRIVFIYRDLRDAAVSLAHHARMGGGELGVVQFEQGGALKHRDLISESIVIIADWWAHFYPWLERADATYRYKELRASALLLGRENESSTFYTGAVGAWRKEFRPYHIQMAKEYFGDWYEMP